MSDQQDFTDRFAIETLRGEFTDAVMTHDFDRFADLFTADGAWRMPHIDAEFTGREEIRAGVERLQGLWEYFVQNTHRGVLRVDGDTATGRVYVSELGRMKDGKAQLNHSLYHDTYHRTDDGWRFAERVYEVKYLDTTPHTGSAPRTEQGAEKG